MVRTPAKVNLGLRVGSPRPDGYHPLATVYQAVSLYDEVKVRPAPAGDFSVTVTGEGADQVPTDDTNLAVQAAKRLAKTFTVHAGVAISIHKTIAVEGGLAGGSSNAAAALVACDALWGTDAGREQLLRIAAQVGSDVPFCLVGGNAVGSGRGEEVSPALARGVYEWVLAFADGGLPTAEVYAELDRMRGTDSLHQAQTPLELMGALRSGDPFQLGMALDNDLQPAALRLRPSLARTLDVGEEYGSLGSIISGSGPTCCFLAANEDHAVDIAVALSGSGVCRSVQRATGPVPGAQRVS